MVTHYKEIDHWALVCEFFAPLGLCGGILTNTEHGNIGSNVLAYEASGDWSAIRDAKGDEIDALYEHLVRTIEERGYADRVAKALSAKGRADKARAHAQIGKRAARDLTSGRISIQG